MIFELDRASSVAGATWESSSGMEALRLRRGLWRRGWGCVCVRAHVLVCKAVRDHAVLGCSVFMFE